MPETENPKTRKPRQKTTAKKTEETPLCHIHDKVIYQDIFYIRQDVCFNDEPLTEFEGKYYCLFHLPDKQKDSIKFGEIISERVKSIEAKIIAAEELPEDKRNNELKKISYDFRFVWFPDVMFFNMYHFKVGVFFNSATFSADTYFIYTTFSADADFNSATFLVDAYFNSANFSGLANFSKTKFSKTGITTFEKTNFVKDAYFDRTRFRSDVSFNSAIFGSDSYILFLRTFFAKNADFRYSTADGDLRFSYLRQGAECTFNFQEVAFEKAKRVSFHTVRLCPSWFVDVDSRKFVFTDINWRNLDYERGNKNIERELGALEKRGIKEQRKRLLEIAARQLAVNSEENNRYEEAAKFRYLAMETKRLEEGKFFSKFLYTLYKWTSGYGENWSWAALVLLIILLLFGVFYDSPFAHFEPTDKKTVNVSADNAQPQPENYKMNNAEGFVYSLYVAALQRPEPKPADTRTRFFVILETIFAPLQVALLALAIRRKFMR
jgi:hypothetical protein